MGTTCGHDEVLSVDFDEVDDDSLEKRLVELTRLQARVEAVRMLVVAEVDRRRMCSRERKRATSTWVSSVCGTDPTRERTLLGRARALVRTTQTRRAAVDGELNSDQLRTLLHARNDRTRACYDAQEDLLVGLARDLDWFGFTHAVRYWSLCNDPDGKEPADHARRRGLTMRRHADGTVSGEFRFDPVVGAAFASALEARTQALFDQDCSAAKERLDRTPLGSDLGRTSSQRGADALAQLVAQGAAGSGRIQAPLVHLTMGWELFCHELAKLAGDHPDTDVLPDRHDPDRRCELVDGTPIHPHVAAAYALVGDVRRIVFSADNEILGHGRSRRLFDRAQTLAIAARDRGRCTNPQCRGTHQLEVDHIVAWANGGATDTSNGQLHCRWDNRQKGTSGGAPTRSRAT